MSAIACQIKHWEQKVTLEMVNSSNRSEYEAEGAHRLVPLRTITLKYPLKSIAVVINESLLYI